MNLTKIIQNVILVASSSAIIYASYVEYKIARKDEDYLYKKQQRELDRLRRKGL